MSVGTVQGARHPIDECHILGRTNGRKHKVAKRESIASRLERLFRSFRRPRSALLREERRDGFLMILPWVVGFLAFTAGPMLFSLYISLNEWDIIRESVFVGLSHYKKLPQDDLFWTSLYNTAYYTFIAVPAHIIAALLVALLMNLKLPGIRWYRTVYYLPSIVPTVANSLLWMWFFNPEYGLANSVLEFLGLPRQAWLWDPVLAKPVFIIMSLWGLGGTMVIFLAGLQGIPQSLYEAATIDGAGRWALFRHVTLPMLTPVIFFSIVMQIISSFQVFTSAYVMTGGGPLNATLFYVLYLWRNGWDYFRMGYASALAWVLFAIILVFTWLQLRMGKLWVFYETE